jgi:hypothetical protein
MCLAGQEDRCPVMEDLHFDEPAGGQG